MPHSTLDSIRFDSPCSARDENAAPRQRAIPSPPSRRRVLQQFAVASAGLACSPSWLAAQNARPDSPTIQRIERTALWRNRDGDATTWFHPRACVLPDGGAPDDVLMTMQWIRGSDYFGPVHATQTQDGGKTWSEPVPVPPLGRVPVEGHPGLVAGVCDVVPEYHPATGCVIAMGHVVFYRGPRFSKRDQLPRYPVYAIRSPNGTWGPRRRLEWDDPRGRFIYSNNCGQRVTLENGEIIMSFTFGAKSEHRQVAGVRCEFDGEQLRVAEVGPPLSLNVGRGLLEPSVTRYQQRFWLTIRAEDGQGYVAVSDDGLNYSEKQPWCWDDGEPLGMSTTQQHWLQHPRGLFLVYTRRDESNVNVIRWRSPLWIAQVDPDRQCLLRETEQVVLPLHGDGINEPDDVPLMGNFHVTPISENESWVTVGEWLPRREARGNLWLARISWN